MNELCSHCILSSYLDHEPPAKVEYVHMKFHSCLKSVCQISCTLTKLFLNMTQKAILNFDENFGGFLSCFFLPKYCLNSFILGYRCMCSEKVCKISWRCDDFKGFNLSSKYMHSSLGSTAPLRRRASACPFNHEFLLLQRGPCARSEWPFTHHCRLRARRLIVSAGSRPWGKRVQFYPACTLSQMIFCSGWGGI